MTMGLKANADGSGAIQVGGSDAITISAALNTTFAGTAAVPTGTLYPIVSGTAVASTSGTSIDFTSIPSWVKRITVMFSGVSTNGSSIAQIQIGTSGGVQTTTYLGAAQSSGGVSNFSSGFLLSGSAFASTVVFHGSVTICLIDSSNGSWAYSGVLGRSDSAQATYTAGSKTLSGTLDRVRITTVNGTDTFDAGSINILYE
jgi:hypothetical protein